MTSTSTQKSPPERVDIDAEFYRFLSGGSRFQLLCSVVDVGLGTLLHHNGPLSVAEIGARLGLDDTRTRKWLLLLAAIDLVEEHVGSDGMVFYGNGPLVQAMVQGGPNTYFYWEFLRYFRQAAAYDIAGLVRGMPVEYPVRYPPVAWDDVVLLHAWMRDGALLTLSTIERRYTFDDVIDILDVGGGDATMAVSLAQRYPHLRITVFNLPQPAILARHNIQMGGVADRVRVVEGDFRYDELPKDYDMVMFSRVLADWPPELCRQLLRKAHDSLRPQGLLLIAEPLRDENFDLAVTWEHSYLPYDDFGAFVYKPYALYEQMLNEQGFTDIIHHKRDDHSIHAVIISRRGAGAASAEAGG